MPGRRGGRWNDHRQVINGILFRVRWSMVSVGSTSCRAHQHASGARKKKPRVPKKGDAPAPPPRRGTRTVPGAA
ncbi:hypothetical protein [Streptomyces filamentosus]|uniref:hypothetical protein n=1 Tax=Streptomyces filamentosus TaxID=67294 RepID=UPI003F4D057F